MSSHDYPMWRRLQQRQDIDPPRDLLHRAKLSFDPICVVTIFLSGSYLSHHMEFHGVLVLAGVFITLYCGWGALRHD